MDPQQPGYNPYEFITNPGTPPKQPLFNSGRSQKSRIIIVAVGLLGLLVVAMIFWVVLGALTGEKFDDAIKLGKTQQKILFTTGLALKESSSPATRAYAKTIEATVLSDYTELETYLKKHVSSNDIKQIGDGQDDEIQEDFDSAKQSGRVDELFRQTLDQLLTDYADDVEIAKNNAKRKSERDILNNISGDIILLQKFKS